MIRNSRGLTHLDLVIALVVLANLAAIGVPRFIAMQSRAREGVVRSNMHLLQVAVEEFASEAGSYPVSGIDGAAVMAMLPGGHSPRNPYTGVSCTIVFGGAASAQGDLGYDDPATDEYRITGFGEKQLLDYVITNEHE